MQHLTYKINNNLNIIAFLPVVKRQKTQQVNPNVYYDDYGVSDLYPSMPSMNFSIILIFLGVIVLLVQIFALLGGILFFVKNKKDYTICPNCKKKIYYHNNRPPKFCIHCATILPENNNK